MTLRTLTAACAIAAAAGILPSFALGDCTECWVTPPLYAPGGIVLPSTHDGPSGIIGEICCENRYKSRWSYGVSCDWTILLDNLTPNGTDTSTVSATAGAFAFDGQLVTGEPYCDFNFHFGPIDADLNSDIDTAYFADVDVSAYAGVDVGFGQARAVARSSPTHGKASVGTTGWAISGNWADMTPGVSGSGSYQGLGFGAGKTMIDGDYDYDVIDPELPTSITFCACVTLDGSATFSSSLADHPDCGGGPGGSGSTSFGFTAVQLTTRADFKNASTSQESTSKGVIAFQDDGTMITLGNLAGANVPDGDPGNDLDRSGLVQMSVQSPVANPTGLAISVTQEAIGELDGDLDDDDDVDCADRDIFLSLVGKTIATDTEYDFRADFDLDGTVEADDYRAFIPLMLDSPDFELADFLCDGVCDNADYYDYLNAYLAGDLSAEVVPDGVVNSKDYAKFVDAFQGGC